MTVLDDVRRGLNRPLRVLVALPQSACLRLATAPLLCKLREGCGGASISGLVQRRTFERETLQSEFAGLVDRRDLVISSRTGTRQFDVLVDASLRGDAAWPAWLAGVPIRIGFSHRLSWNVPGWLYTNTVVSRSRRFWEQQAELFGPLSEGNGPVQTAVASRSAARRIERFLNVAHLLCGYVAVSVAECRQLQARQLGKLARHLGELNRIPTLVLWYGARERAASEQMVAQSGGHAVAVPELTSLELLEAIRAAELLVAGSSEVESLAQGVGTPAILASGLGVAEPQSGLRQDLVSLCDQVLASSPAAIRLAGAA